MEKRYYEKTHKHRKIALTRHESKKSSVFHSSDYMEREDRLIYNYKQFKRFVNESRKKSRIPLTEIKLVFPSEPIIYFFGEHKRQYTTTANKCKLLYIGETINPMNRLADHVSSGPAGLVSKLAYHEQEKFMGYDGSYVDEKDLIPATYEESTFEHHYNHIIKTAHSNIWWRAMYFPCFKYGDMRKRYESYFIQRLNPLLNRALTSINKRKRPSRIQYKTTLKAISEDPELKKYEEELKK